jgi:hypothetical protein
MPRDSLEMARREEQQREAGKGNYIIGAGISNQQQDFNTEATPRSVPQETELEERLARNSSMEMERNNTTTGPGRMGMKTTMRDNTPEYQMQKEQGGVERVLREEKKREGKLEGNQDVPGDYPKEKQQKGVLGRTKDRVMGVIA